MSTIWTPASHRFTGLSEARKAVQDYDPNLDFGFNEVTQQWCVYLKQGTMGASKDADLPILGFNQIPGRDEIQKRLYNSDAMRRGHEILDQINRHNDEITERGNRRTDEAAGEVAETLEWAYRKMGSDKSPTSKVFFPGKDD